MKLYLEWYRRDVDSHKHAKFMILRNHYGGLQGFAMEAKFWILNDLIARKDYCVLYIKTARDRQAVAAALCLTQPELDKFITYLISEECELLWQTEDGGYSNDMLQDCLSQAMKGREYERAKKQRQKENKDLPTNPLNNEFPEGNPLNKGGNETFPGGTPPKEEGKNNTLHNSTLQDISPTDFVEQGSTPKPPTLEEQYQEIISRDVEKSKKDFLICSFIVTHRPKFHKPYYDVWNIFAEKHKKPKAERVTPKRTGHLNARLKEKEFDLMEVLKVAKDCKLLLKKSWFNFDFIIKNADNSDKIVSGQYADDKIDAPPPVEEGGIEKKFKKLVHG